MCQGLREDEFNTTLNNIKKNYCGLCTNIKKNKFSHDKFVYTNQWVLINAFFYLKSMNCSS